MEWVWSGFLLSLSLCLDLGTVNVAVMRTGVEKGLGPAFLMSLGSGVGDLIYAGVSLVGIHFLLDHTWVRWVLWIGGTALLLFLAFRMLREALRPETDRRENVVPSPGTGTPSRTFFWGIGLALSSPSAILWFATVGGSVIASSGEGDNQASLVLFFTGFFLAGLTWALFLSAASAKGGEMAGPRLVRRFSLLSVLLFLYFSIKVFLDGYEQFL